MRPSRFLVVMFVSALVLLGVSAAQDQKAVVQGEDRAPTGVSFVWTSLDGTSGSLAGSAAVVQATDGNLYGTTTQGGAYNYGTVFRITSALELSSLYSFCAASNCTDGTFPSGGLVQGPDRNFYGMTVGGGNGIGTVFKITSGGVLTTLHTFDGPEGEEPADPLILSNGNFYGTTFTAGGIPTGKGTVFKMSPSGSLTILYTFCSQTNCADGANPYAGLVQASDGNLYGTTQNGGAVSCPASTGCGTVFRITPAGAVTTLHSFSGSPDGEFPGGLTQASDGNLYGITQEGGSNNQGTVFKMTVGGVLTTIYNFCTHGGSQCTDGYGPSAALVQATDGNLYGTTFGGGANGYGTVFELTRQGKLTTLWSFDSSNGAYPGPGSLVQATNGTFYGSTRNGGAFGDGVVFSLNAGLSPFVAFLQRTGKIGSTAQILGQGLTGTTGVTFNGIPATSFKVVKDTYMTAVVPIGATTGKVVVTTPTGTLTSNVSFRIIQ